MVLGRDESAGLDNPRRGSSRADTCACRSTGTPSRSRISTPSTGTFVNGERLDRPAPAAVRRPHQGRRPWSSSPPRPPGAGRWPGCAAVPARTGRDACPRDPRVAARTGCDACSRGARPAGRRGRAAGAQGRHARDRAARRGRPPARPRPRVRSSARRRGRAPTAPRARRPGRRACHDRGSRLHQRHVRKRGAPARAPPTRVRRSRSSSAAPSRVPRADARGHGRPAGGRAAAHPLPPGDHAAEQGPHRGDQLAQVVDAPRRVHGGLHAAARHHDRRGRAALDREGAESQLLRAAVGDQRLLADAGCAPAERGGGIGQTRASPRLRARTGHLHDVLRRLRTRSVGRRARPRPRSPGHRWRHDVRHLAGRSPRSSHRPERGTAFGIGRHYCARQAGRPGALSAAPSRRGSAGRRSSTSMSRSACWLST